MNKEISKYRIIWLYLFIKFEGGEEGKNYQAQKFRKFLKANRYEKINPGTWCRHISKKFLSQKMVDLKNAIPEGCSVSILQVTDKQFGNMVSFKGIEDGKVIQTGYPAD